MYPWSLGSVYLETYESGNHNMKKIMSPLQTASSLKSLIFIQAVFGVLVPISFFCRDIYAAPLTYVRPLLYGPTSLYKINEPNETDAFLFRQIYSNLVKMGKNGEIIPDLAEKWTVSDDGKKIVFNIRKGIKCHDNSDLTMEDIVRSIDRSRTSNTHFKSMLTPIDRVYGDEKLRLITVYLHLKNPLFIRRFADYSLSILKKDNLDQVSGSGPFKVIQSNTSLANGITLAKFDKYFGNPAEIEKIELPILSKAEAMEQFGAGKLDDLDHFSLDEKDRKMLGDKCIWQFDELPTMRFLIIKANTNPALATAGDRDCLISMIDRDLLVSNLYSGQKPLESITPKVTFGSHLVPYKKPEYKCTGPQKQSLLSRLKKTPIKIPYLAAGAGFLQHLFDELDSAKVPYTKIVKSDYLASFQHSDVDMYLAKYTPTSPDLEGFVHAFAGDPPFFATGLPSRRFARAINRMEQESHLEKRLKYAAMPFLEIDKERTFIPLHSFIFSGCHKANWQNYRTSFLGFIAQEMSSIKIK